VGGSKVTDGGAKEIAKSLPDCDIKTDPPKSP
jgi:hypothetical protein